MRVYRGDYCFRRISYDHFFRWLIWYLLMIWISSKKKPFSRPSFDGFTTIRLLVERSLSRWWSMYDCRCSARISWRISWLTFLWWKIVPKLKQYYAKRDTFTSCQIDGLNGPHLDVVYAKLQVGFNWISNNSWLKLVVYSGNNKLGISMSRFCRSNCLCGRWGRQSGTPQRRMLQSSQRCLVSFEESAVRSQ